MNPSLFSAQCLNCISMVGFHIITLSWRIMLLWPVMIPIPVLWSYGERSTQQLLSALLQILWTPKIHSMELFSPFSVFVLLWSLYFLLECVLSEKDRKRKPKKLKNSTIHLKWGLSRLPIPCNLDTEQTFFVWKCFLLLILNFLLQQNFAGNNK